MADRDGARLPGRHGGDLVVEALSAVGIRTVFGIPGQHALALFDALRRSDLAFYSSRVENNAAFAADGYARASGVPSALFLSTGPGALTALSGLQEAFATAVPMVVVVSQVPVHGLGGARRGMLHQLDEQRRSAENVTKAQFTVRHQAAIGDTVIAAFDEAMSHPRGPVWIEIPQDVLLGETVLPRMAARTPQPRAHAPRVELLAEAAALLGRARRPAVLAGGGVRRSGAEAVLLDLARRIDAPVVCSPGGVGAFPVDDPLSLGSWVEDRAVTDLLADADVLLAVGTSLGEVTSNYFTLAPSGQLVQVDAQMRVLETNHLALGIAGDAGDVLRDLLDRLPAEGPVPDREDGAARAAAVRARVTARLDAQDVGHERALMAALREGVPDDALTYWDMTMAAYWAWNCWDSRSGAFHSAQGAGGLGVALPAAVGGAVAQAHGGDRPRRVLAVSGDGSAAYGLAELACAVQHRLPVTWVIVDDGGYGILREYMVGAFGQATHTDLVAPDFVALAHAFGVPASQVVIDREAPEQERAEGYAQLRTALSRSFATMPDDGPEVIVVRTRLRMFDPS